MSAVDSPAWAVLKALVALLPIEEVLLAVL